MPKAKPLPPIPELRRMLAYRSDGVLIWKRVQRHSGRKPGNVAGCINSLGYWRIGISNVNYRAHRIVWAIIKREDPLGLQIDHINGNRLDNRIENLRKATPSQNQRNRKNTKGYNFHKNQKKWNACIQINGRMKHIGCFDTEEQAREAYLRAKEKLHGEFMPADMKHELGQIDGPTSQLNFFDD